MAEREGVHYWNRVIDPPRRSPYLASGRGADAKPPMGPGGAQACTRRWVTPGAVPSPGSLPTEPMTRRISTFLLHSLHV